MFPSSGEGRKSPTLLGPIESANICNSPHHRRPVIEVSSFYGTRPIT
jgi:hypothetical protein